MSTFEINTRSEFCYAIHLFSEDYDVGNPPSITMLEAHAFDRGDEESIRSLFKVIEKDNKELLDRNSYIDVYLEVYTNDSSTANNEETVRTYLGAIWSDDYDEVKE